MSTPHNSAKKGEIAKIVLMPGDPLRAKFISENYLEEAVLFNEVRNMYGYTGTYNGVRVSVMASGMGMPSMGIYSYELFKEYDVDHIIRIGSAGSYCKEADLYDVILVNESYTESTYGKVQNGYEKNLIESSKELNHKIKKSASELGIKIQEGKIHTTDVFYRDVNKDYYKELYKNEGCLGVEMESFALFHNAKVCNKEASAIVTISDSFVSDKTTTAQERQNSFSDMMEIALNTIKLI